MRHVGGRKLRCRVTCLRALVIWSVWGYSSDCIIAEKCRIGRRRARKYGLRGCYCGWFVGCTIPPGSLKSSATAHIHAFEAVRDTPRTRYQPVALEMFAAAADASGGRGRLVLWGRPFVFGLSGRDRCRTLTLSRTLRTRRL